MSELYYSFELLGQSKHIIIEMAYIKQLIQSLFDEESQGNIESFKKLIYLAVNQTQLFAPHALELANTICPILHGIDDTTTKIYALQLLAQLTTNYRDQIPPEVYDFQQIVVLLSDQNAEVRKAAHYLLLIFIKKYERIDQIMRGYLQKVRDNADQWKQIQKIIHSFQSLLVIEPKCVTYPHNFALMEDFLRLVIAFRSHQHSLIQKASQQTVASFVKNQYTPKILGKFDKAVSGELVQFAEKLGINLLVKVEQQPKAEPERTKARKTMSQLERLLESIQNESDWKVKSEIIEEISKRLESVGADQITEDLVNQMLDYTYDYNFKICITAMNIVLMLLMKYPQEVRPRLKKIEDVMVEKICDLKMAVRQIAVKILKKIFSNQSKDSAKKMLNKLASCSVVGKEEILTFFQDYYTCQVPVDLSLVLNQVASQLSNENTKIKIKTLDCLVRVSLTSGVQECKYILQKKLNKVYYDMYLDRLKERGTPDTKSERWEDAKNNNINKGMTWQGERSPNMAQSDNNRFLTKVQFAKKVDKTPQEDTFYDFKYEAPTFGGMEKKERNEDQLQRKDQKFMLGTSHTSNKTESTYQNQRQEQNIKSVNSKVIKKAPSQSYKANSISNSANNLDEYPLQEKKLPLKPKPIKKSAMENQILKQQNTNLVIHSKQYQNKNTYQQPRQQKVEIKSEKVFKQKITRAKQQKVEKVEKQASEQKDIEMDRSAKEPFSIKKVASKKQHQIDYKATHYAAKQELAPVANPKELLREITTNICKDSQWSKQFDSLDALRRLIKNHQDFYPQIFQNLATIMPEVLKLVESLRSSLAKNAMITLAEMCEAFKKSMDPFLEAIFIKLIRKAQDTNSFIIDQVNKCIKSLCHYCSIPKIGLIIINNSQAKSIPIKLKIALCLQKLLQKQNYSLNTLKQNPKLLGVMGSYITDGSQQVRNLTKQIFIGIQCNNSAAQVQGIFRKSSKEAWQKFRTIIDRDLK